ncbi:YcnI family protein [Microbacterium oryzae]|uniref:YcnI family protein n=1 Tax=Microbacterium oryzae TaxID=743009 RepID=UPI0025B1FB57|nr:YcnI family protein [Microbacterium oryzae]MDN3311465.1 YcnI family protein [Microbacterium oryzae]
MTSLTPAPRRRRGLRALASGALAAALVIGAPLAASAHVTVTPDAPVAGGYDVLTFAFSHGCDESPTTALVISPPAEGLESVVPTVQAGWSIDVERDPDTGVVDAITYTADEPVPNALRAAVELSVAYSADAPETLAFPVEQLCVDGSTSWTELADEGEDPHDLDSPAPVVTLAPAAEGADHGTSTHDAADGDADVAEEAAAADGSGVGAWALGAGGLLAGVAALVVSVLAYRRSGQRR